MLNFDGYEIWITVDDSNSSCGRRLCQDLCHDESTIFEEIKRTLERLHDFDI
jgi:hypothetical protein